MADSELKVSPRLSRGWLSTLIYTIQREAAENRTLYGDPISL
jgi:hypothetical protein